MISDHSRLQVTETMSGETQKRKDAGSRASIVQQPVAVSVGQWTQPPLHSYLYTGLCPPCGDVFGLLFL